MKHTIRVTTMLAAAIVIALTGAVEANDMLNSVQEVAESLGQNPNSLIFPTRQPPDPQPKASPR